MNVEKFKIKIQKIEIKLGFGFNKGSSNLNHNCIKSYQLRRSIARKG
jgi:hypothetical protein